MSWTAAPTPPVNHRPFEAQRRALTRRRLQRPSRLARDAELRDWVTASFKSRWSPEQVSRGLRRAFPDQPGRLALRRDHLPGRLPADLSGPPRELPGRVLRLLRRRRLPRRLARARRSGSVRRMTLIHDRPETVLDCVEPGHWEGDLIMGAANLTAIVTLVERTTRCTRRGHLPDGRHDSVTVRDAIVAALVVLPPHLRLTLTWDQGKGMALHLEVAAALGMTTVYFCDPRSPWQRPETSTPTVCYGATIPRAPDLSVHSADDLTRVQAELNVHTRRILAWESPADRMAMLLETLFVLRR